MARRIRQLSGLSLAQWLWLSMSVISLPLTGASLRCLGYQRTRTFLPIAPARNNHRGNGNPQDLMRAQTIARMVGIAAHHGPFRANCLSQSLVLHMLLSWAGIPAEFKFGIPVQVPEQSMKTFTAHAWVEYAGVNLSDSGKIQRYAIFAG